MPALVTGALIKKITAALQQEPLIKAACLSGSLGRGAGDEYSDVDVLALTEDGQEDAVFHAFKNKIAEISPLIFSKTIQASRTINAITPAWERFDLTFTGRAQLKTKSGLKVLFDPQGLIAQLSADAAPGDAAKPAAVADLANEFLRVLGLMPVVINRAEFIIGQTGSILLRDMLIRLMMLENAPQPLRGALSLSQSLTQEQLDILLSVPPLTADKDGIFRANKFIAKQFLPRARSLAEKTGASWPGEFEEKTLSYLKDRIGFLI
jgi:predicted nucleotidyltransferase